MGRPSPLYFAERLTRHLGGARIYLKREDLNHTGAHKINNTLGQALLAKRMGKQRRDRRDRRRPARGGCCNRGGHVQHRSASSTWARRTSGARSLNVFRMRLLGADVMPVASGSRTLKDAMNEAIRDWVTNVRTTYYL